MSQSQQVYAAQNSETPVEHDTTTVLEALHDDDCRLILEATSDESLTASELSETCDLPLSTTYRKLDRLTDVGLLRETIRLYHSGKHVNEYTRNVEDVTITVTDEGDFDITVTHTVSRTKDNFHHPSHHA